MRIGVLGGAGFIGGHLVAHLAAAGHQVRVGDIAEWRGEQAEFVPCDVRELEQVRTFIRGLDAVFNLAAEHRDDVRPLARYEAVNVGGAQVLCDAARQAGVGQLLFTSSVAVYGIPEGVATEESPLRPFNEYGRTKRDAEVVYRAWAEEVPSRRLAIVRPTVVFGAGNRGNVYNLVNQVARGRFVMVGDGRNKKSLAYVENVAGFLVHALSFGPGVHLTNYADGPDMDMNELIAFLRANLKLGPGVGPRLPYPLGLAIGAAFDAVALVTGRSLPFSAVRVKKFCANTRIGAARIDDLGYRRPYALAEGLHRFLESDFGAPGVG
jgi:nucleoside-diphosphate-sugar epimerase